MKVALKSLVISRTAATCILLCSVPGCSDNSRERAEAQVQRMANDLDGRTTETGVYVRVKEADLKETDPWGTRIKVGYSQGGIAEIVEVRSAGPDREFNTADDVVADRMAANLKGIGEGIKKNVEDTASRAAKGVVKGAMQGVKESIAESKARKKKQRDVDVMEETPWRSIARRRVVSTRSRCNGSRRTTPSPPRPPVLSISPSCVSCRPLRHCGPSGSVPGHWDPGRTYHLTQLDTYGSIQHTPALAPVAPRFSAIHQPLHDRVSRASINSLARDAVEHLDRS